jgi:hypothetical protein
LIPGNPRGTVAFHVMNKITCRYAKSSSSHLAGCLLLGVSCGFPSSTRSNVVL